MSEAITGSVRPAAVAAGVRQQAGSVAARRRRRPHYGTHIFLVVVAIMWLIPLAWALYVSLRPIEDTNKYGYFAIAHAINFQNYIDAWNGAGFLALAGNSAAIVIPSVVLTLLLASSMAFAVSRFTWKFNVTLLIAFTAGNLLPPQVLAAPLFEAFKLVKLPYWLSDSGTMLNQTWSVVIVDTAFQVGFCTFVLSNYMKALPTELTEAARVDGAGVWRQYVSVVMPLTRPALAALGTLEVIFIYNDYFWPLILIQDPSRYPLTTGVNNLRGEFQENFNLLAAGAMITAIPTLIIYLALQRQFVAGLTLGASKG